MFCWHCFRCMLLAFLALPVPPATSRPASPATFLPLSFPHYWLLIQNSRVENFHLHSKVFPLFGWLPEEASVHLVPSTFTPLQWRVVEAAIGSNPRHLAEFHSLWAGWREKEDEFEQVDSCVDHYLAYLHVCVAGSGLEWSRGGSERLSVARRGRRVDSCVGHCLAYSLVWVYVCFGVWCGFVVVWYVVVWYVGVWYVVVWYVVVWYVVVWYVGVWCVCMVCGCMLVLFISSSRPFSYSFSFSAAQATEVEPAMQAALTHLERFGEQLASGEQPRWAARFGSPWGNAPGTWSRWWVEWRERRRGKDRVKWRPEIGYGVDRGNVRGRREALEEELQEERGLWYTKGGEVPEGGPVGSGKEEEEEEERWMEEEEEERGEYRRQLREWARFQMMDFVHALATAEFGVNYGKDSGEEFMEDPAAAALLKVGLLYQQRDPMYVRPTSVAFQRCLTRWLVELVRLREANVRLEAEVSRLRDKSDRLEGERRRLSARLAAVHTAMQQLEREAAIRSRTRAEATMGVQQKGWNRWFSGDPSAMERVLETAEDARVERAAAAATVEKLVEENARLVQQMNEQKLLIANLVTTMRTTVIPGTPSGIPASSQNIHAGLLAAAASAALPVRATSASEYTLTADVAGLGLEHQAAIAGSVGGNQERVPVAHMSQKIQDECSRSPSPRPTTLHPSALFPAATDGGLHSAANMASVAAGEGSRGSHSSFLTADGPSSFLQSTHSSSSSLAADASSLLPVVRSAPPPSAALCAQQPTPTLSETSSRYPAIWPVTYSERESEGAGGGGMDGGAGAVAVNEGNGMADVRAQGMVVEAGSVVAAGGGAGGVGVGGTGEVVVRRAGGVERNEVSLIDSPLVGAPFRLAFFLVKVVSKTGIVQRLAGRLAGGRNKDSGAGGEKRNVRVDGVGSSVGML
ncbi:unnamed protein product [Closterium sp. Yama58-4]|nr:unnamed protein product [Closterium sp. Yama58-4]